MTSIVQMRNISLTYHSPKTETLAVDNLSLEIKKGELVGLVGPSGCGKTTILSLISGFLNASQGTITVCNLPPLEAREKIGYMLQKDELLPWRTIKRNILLGLEIRHNLNKETSDYALQLLEKYHLAEFKDFYPQQLSGGMRQRVALIRTLALSPEILLLDEPFSALDFQTRLSVVKDVRSIIKTEDITAIFVTHDISEAISMCDRIVILSPRPCHIKKTICLDELMELTPLARREHPHFSKYFNEIWRELDNTEKKNE